MAITKKSVSKSNIITIQSNSKLLQIIWMRSDLVMILTEIQQQQSHSSYISQAISENPNFCIGTFIYTVYVIDMIANDREIQTVQVWVLPVLVCMSVVSLVCMSVVTFSLISLSPKSLPQCCLANVYPPSLTVNPLSNGICPLGWVKRWSSMGAILHCWPLHPGLVVYHWRKEIHWFV